MDDIGTYLPKQESGSMPVREVLVAKRQREVLTIGPKDTVYAALSRMAAKNVGALVVVDGERVVGVVSERDYARKVILIGKASRETAVEEIMGTPAVTVSTGTTVAECMALMTSRHLRHLPVLVDGVLVGLVSIGDLVKALLADQQARLGKIEAYISGTYPT
ncbi:MAG TPA: CBS domain-containing protein [Candidatus Methanoperedens sp.]|nr:CBS domain-containing protein [Candidatus Methanoperedens sp.]